MSNPTYTTRVPETLTADSLAELALNLRWAFNHSADVLWQTLDPVLWDLTHNPWFVLQTVSPERLAEVTGDEEFKGLLDDLVREKRENVTSGAWFQLAYPQAPLTAVAYFSMEFMLHEALPIYSGGLGNVAGDQLKTASNLGVPIVAVGLLYQQGYFRQEIDARGSQQVLYPFNDPSQLPIRPLREENGQWLRFPLPFPGRVLWIRAWEVHVGRNRLYLLDTNDPANAPAQRGIGSELYGGDSELRLKQELVLGVGGWRLLRALGLRPDVCHLNEGHAAFAVLERARCFMEDERQMFGAALNVTRAGNLFTTHTPVEAGIDRFDPRLIRKYVTAYAEKELCISIDDLLALGRRDSRNASEPFNMAYLAIHGSGRINGVSQLHGDVSRRMFQVLFPRWPTTEVPVTHVTNGVHVPTWDSADADLLWETACGKDRWRGAVHECTGAGLRAASDEELWRFRTSSRASFVQYVRERLSRQLAEQGAPPEEVAAAETVFGSDVLTAGFARRFATYKRPNLLLHDPDRLARILANPSRPIQLIVAGKAHPEDGAGQALIRQWMSFIRRSDVAGRVVFLGDYDMLMAEHIVQGIDLWINTPRRPWEACGTSGMKVLVNGGLNLSELDGWWAEAYAPEVGWAIGDGKDRGDDAAWDAVEADALYGLLEGDIASSFYTRDEHGVPNRWVSRMRESMMRLTPAFSSNRAVRQYTEDHYLPAAAAYRARASEGGRAGADILSWQTSLARHWHQASFGRVDVVQEGNSYTFRVALCLGDLSPEDVRVELYADPLNGTPAVRQSMARSAESAGLAGSFQYTARVLASRPASDFTPRLIPFRADVSVPLEAPFILWCDRK
jgi:glycogen phosphorylase